MRDKMPLVKYILLPLLLYIAVLYATYLIVSHRVATISTGIYEAEAHKIAAETRSIIDAHMKLVSGIAMTLSHDDRYAKALLGERYDQLDLKRFAAYLQSETSMKHIWFQLIDKKGRSVYRSWTDKRGDSLLKARLDVAEMIRHPAVQTTISTGIFDMTFKAMIPIYNGKTFIGMIEAISKFNAVAQQLSEQGYAPVILVDKSYRKQLTKPFTGRFVDDYYVANLNAGPKYLDYIRRHGVEHFVDATSSYRIDPANDLYCGFFRLNGLDGKPMGHFILFKPLHTFDLSDAENMRIQFYLYVTFLYLLLYLSYLYVTLKHNRDQVALRNELLSDEVYAKARKIETQQRFLQSVIDGVSDSLMVIDSQCEILLMNKSAAQFADMRFAQDANHPKCYEAIHHRPEICSNAKTCPVANSTLTDMEQKSIHKHTDGNGHLRHIEISWTPMYDASGVRYATIQLGRDITDHLKVQDMLREQQTVLDYQAHHDALTRLPNRLLFMDRLHHAIRQHQRSGKKIALLFIDLDRFKEINDSLGHGAGDAILIETARRLRHHLRLSDTVARLGGDEFTIIIESIENVNEVVTIVEKIISRMHEPFMFEERQLHSSASIGISLYPDDGNTPELLLQNADAAMYKAKEEGRNTYQFYTQEMTDLAFERLLMENSLRQGLSNDEFAIYFQPQFNMRSKKLIGLEALVRWQNPVMGLLTPGAFIHIAEETGLIVPIGNSVLEQTFRQVASWHVKGYNPGRVSINLSVKQLQQIEIVDDLRRMLEATQCRPEWIELEVTEGYVMKDLAKAVEILESLRAMGITIALDDFGTGYASLAYLKELPIQKLKIDRTFIHALPGEEDDEAIARTIIDLARNIHIDVIAEGVENADQEHFLVENGCLLAQGYYYAKPMPVERLEAEMLEATR